MKHFEYIHNFLKELEKLVPTKEEIRHNITLCKKTGKLQISIFYKNGWNAVDMDKTYEDNATYHQLAKGVFELIQ